VVLWSPIRQSRLFLGIGEMGKEPRHGPGSRIDGFRVRKARGLRAHSRPQTSQFCKRAHRLHPFEKMRLFSFGRTFLKLVGFHI
jgi:hypothetical protein